MIAVLTAYTVREAWQVVFLLKAGKTFTVPEAILWTSNSLLIMLLIEAIRISCGGDCSHGSGRHRYLGDMEWLPALAMEFDGLVRMVPG